MKVNGSQERVWKSDVVVIVVETVVLLMLLIQRHPRLVIWTFPCHRNTAVSLTKHGNISFGFINRICVLSVPSGTEISNDSVFSKVIMTVRKNCEILQRMRSEVDGIVYVSHDGKQ